MCDFCKYIFDYQLLYGRFRGNSQNKQMQDKEKRIFKSMNIDDNYLTKNCSVMDGESIDIVAETGDCFCTGIVEDIKYCPYCGRDLKENE